MEKNNLCKPLIERVLGIKIKSLSYVEPEKSFEAKLRTKGIRLDLFVIDEDGVAYDIEMQMVVLCQDLVQHKMRNFNYFQLTNSDSLATLAL